MNSKFYLSDIFDPPDRFIQCVAGDEKNVLICYIYFQIWRLSEWLNNHVILLHICRTKYCRKELQEDETQIEEMRRDENVWIIHNEPNYEPATLQTIIV